nr:toll/interleukin-1 receptor domain-containing protein [candidate division Zixibacteria bacterium]
MTKKADHLFISYAGEDWVFAEWLARKLASEGYAVWFDRLKLLGGESYPKDIDYAIKKRTFRLLALLSRSSIDKPNPRKERTLALNIAREEEIDFLIPLNVDGLSATELDWMTNDLTFIPFHRSWHQGLQQLQKKLKSIDAPKTLEDGRQRSLQSYEPKVKLNEGGEQLISNICPIVSLPSQVYKYTLRKSLSRLDKSELQSRWAYVSRGSRGRGHKELLAFQLPPVDFDMALIANRDVHSLDKEKLDGMPTNHIISALLHKSIRNEFLRLGCKEISGARVLYFPAGILKQDRIEFRNYTGRNTYVFATGTRKYTRQGEATTYYYHLCPVIKIRQDLSQSFLLQLGTRLHIADSHGDPLPPRSALSRRKRIAKSWFNHQWLSRILAIRSFLAQGSDNIVIDDRMGGTPIVVGPILQSAIPVGIGELPEQEEDLIDVTDHEFDEDKEDADDESYVD